MDTESALQDTYAVALTDDEKSALASTLREETALSRLTHEEVMALFPFMESRNFWVCSEQPMKQGAAS